MTSRDFCYWLQGFIELHKDGKKKPSLNAEQFKSVEKHLRLVFKHEIDPSFPDQTVLQEIHDRKSVLSDGRIMC